MALIFLEEKNLSYIPPGNVNIGPGTYSPEIIPSPSFQNKKYPAFMSTERRELPSPNYSPGIF